MSDLPKSVVRLSDLAGRHPREVVIEPNATERAAVARELDIIGIRKLRFAATLSPLGRRDWSLSGQLGATVVQQCVVTLDPVTTRIDEPVRRTYMAELPDPGPGEVEMPEDDTIDPLPAAIDLAEVMIEALALALPPFPRAQGVEPVDMAASPAGAAPLTDAEIRPFAGLAGLRESLENKADDEDETP